jgi:uncharacterized protein YbgA (DUF1722 family)
MLVVEQTDFLKNHTPTDDKQELPNFIKDYRQELEPLIVPLTLLQPAVLCFDLAEV